MKIAFRCAVVLAFAGALQGAIADGAPPASHALHPELAYLKAVNAAAPPRDPQLLFLLMAQYSNANRHGEGAEFISETLKKHEARLAPPIKSLYLSAIALLRAGHAGQVPLLGRIGWVNETVAMLQEAKRLSGGQIFVVRWISGVVSAQLPAMFDQRQGALEDLAWCLENSEKALHPGWLREVYYQLGRLHDQGGDKAKAQDFLRRSGFPGFDKPITLTTPYSMNIATGHKFAAKRIAEVVPGRVYALSGFEFTEYYFVVSDDRRELIGIDAGTRPDSAQATYEALRAAVNGLPPLTTIFITHSHWDHVGGHRYFRTLQPAPRFVARSNYHEEIARGLGGAEAIGRLFFGSRFDAEDVRSFKPDVTVDRRTEHSVGGTRVELIPVQGGETNDALFIHLPGLGVTFVGDFVMPYLGAPFLEEGNLDGLLEAIAILAQLQPKHLLHGHEPLTRFFSSTAMLSTLGSRLAWLREQVRGAIRRGEDRAAIHQANLIPPDLLSGDPAAHLPYLLMRENVINRIYDQTAGYWQADLQGLDALGRRDRGSLLVDYLGLSEKQLAEAAARMIADGKHELAAAALDWTRDRFPGSKPIAEVERLAYLKLMEKYQDINPFKLILYSGRIGVRTPQIEPPRPPRGAQLQ